MFRRAPPEIRSLLRRVSAILRLQAAARGLEYLIAGGAAYLLATVAADEILALSSPARAKALAALAVASVVWLVFGVVVPAARRVNPVYAASLVERAFPECESALVTLIEPNGSLDDGVRALLEERLARVLAGATARRCAPRGELARAHTAVSAVMVASIAAALIGGAGFVNSLVRVAFPASEGLAASPGFGSVTPGDVELREGESIDLAAETSGLAPRAVRARFRAASGGELDCSLSRRGGRWTGRLGPVESPGSYVLEGETAATGGSFASRSFSVAVRRYPRADDIRVRYEYPAYTGLAARTVAGGRVDCVEGARARVEFRPAAAVSRATAFLEPGGSLEPALVEPGLMAFSFIVRASGSWRLSLVSKDGLTGEAGPFPVTVRADSAPEAVLLPESAAGGGGRPGGAAVLVRSSDDYGLAKAELVLRGPGPGPGVERIIAIPGVAGRKSLFERVELPVEALAGLGSAVRLALRVTDNRRPLPNVTVSRERELEMASAPPERSMLEPPPRSLVHKRFGDDAPSGGEPREMETAQGPGQGDRPVQRLGGEGGGEGDGGAQSPPKEPPRPPQGGKAGDYAGLTGEGAEPPPAAEGSKGEPGKKEPVPGGAGKSPEGQSKEGEAGKEGTGSPSGGGKAAPPGRESGGERRDVATQPQGRGEGGGGEGGSGGEPIKLGGESPDFRGETTEVPETLDERRVKELDFSDNEVARLAGKGESLPTDYGSRSPRAGEVERPAGEGSQRTTTRTPSGAKAAQAAGAGAPKSLERLVELPIDPAAPSGAQAVELSNSVEPEYRELVEEYFRRLGEGK